MTVRSSGEQFSGGTGCFGQDSRWRGVCSGCPAEGMVLATGETLTWASRADNSVAIRYDTVAETSSMAGWELCFA